MENLLNAQWPFEPEMIHIPAGEFLMGSDPAQEADAKNNECPQHSLYLPDYAIARTPVTNAQYAAFLLRSRHPPPPHWRVLLLLKHRWAPFKKGRYPVVHVSWHDARAYCRWLAEKTGKPYRLPSEAEWEKAARGTDGRRYPWGNIWDATKCNIQNANPKSGTTPVNAYPGGASPYGVLDTVGNVWEWTSSLWGPDLDAPAFTYPYNPEDGRENQAANDAVRRILRGVSFYNDRHFARCAARYRYSPRNRYDSVGFRVALSL